MKKIAVPLVLALFATTACWPFASDEQGDMTVKRVTGSGRVQILRDDETIAVTDPVPLEAGDVVSTSGSALARVKLVGSDVVNVGRETELRIESTKAVEGPLHTGSLVAETEGSMRVDFAGVAATSTGGTFRIDKGVASIRAGAYTGSWKLETPGQPRVALSKLFEVQAAASALRGSEPSQLDNSDPWDRVYLKDLVALDEDLTPLARGLQSQLGNSRPDLAYFAALANQDVGFMKSYLSRPTIDLLTGFVIANHSPGAMAPDFRRAFRLADEGAKWPVVAGILGASFDPLVAELTNIAAATGAVAGGSGNQAVFSVAAAEAVNGAGPGETVVAPPGDGGGGDDDQTDPGGGDDDDDDGTAVEPDPSESPADCNSSTECGVRDVVDRIPRPSPSPSSLTDPLEGLPK